MYALISQVLFYRECSPSYRLSIGVSGEEEEESDLDTLALCPSFNKDNAMV